MLANQAGPVRAFVVGTAGSGKSTLLRQVTDLLTLHGVPSVRFDDWTDVDAVPAAEVLLVDDLHQVSAGQLTALCTRAARPDASLVVASRPARGSSSAKDVARLLERSALSIVLGEVSQADVAGFFRQRDQVIPQSCLDQIFAATGGVAWLVSAALAMHEVGECDDAQHVDLSRDLEARILHRLDTVPEPLRRWVELSCVGGLGHAGLLQHDVNADERIAEAFSEGLLLRNGLPVPVVRSAVRGALPAHRVIDLGALGAEPGVRSPEDASFAGHDRDPIDSPDLVIALLRNADRLLETDPERAGEFYASALAAGPQDPGVSLRQALAAWHAGALDVASMVLDPLLSHSEESVRVQAADIAAAVWAARGLTSTASRVYSALPPLSASSLVRATIAHIGAGHLDPVQTAAADAHSAGALAPSTLDIALQLLAEGLHGSLQTDPPAYAVSRLVRASGLYTASRASDPLPELPAVIAASAALGAGELVTAQRVIDEAVSGGQGGRWARRRLLLWQAFVALQGERPADARAALEAAEGIPLPTSPRDEFLHQAVLVSLARRYRDMAALESAWAAANVGVRHLDVDVYTLLPLGALLCAAARVGDDVTLSPSFTQGLEILRRLGSPPLWSLHLRWAAVQQGILLDKPDLLRPHAKALVAASGTCAVAEVMSRAGGVWVAVLGGTVEPDSVEAAAQGLAAIGLAWDGARLAAHGAGRASDRRVSARLLTVARSLHPTGEEARRADTSSTSATETRSAAQEVGLTDRELDVALLVLQGKTYSEIGEAIFVSPRTVEHHVSHIKRRLSVTSRSDMIAKLRLLVQAEGHQLRVEQR